MSADFLVPIAAMVTGLILLVPVVRAVVRVAERKISGKSDGEELMMLRDELRIVQERLDRVEYGDDRIAELEERLDFAERLLAQQRELPRVKGGA
jgi:hypothetical protein